MTTAGNLELGLINLDNPPPLVETPTYIAPDSFLSEGHTFHTPGRNYSLIIVPTYGSVHRFRLKLSEFLEISLDSPMGEMEIGQIMEECVNQVGDCYNRDPMIFLRNLSGNAAEGGNVPGYPSRVHLAHHNLTTDEKWPRFVMLFREFALDLYYWVQPLLNNYSNYELILEKMVGDDLGFICSPIKNPYPI